MRWFRSNIRHGARLALLALVVQFALSFGHTHALAAQAAPTVKSAMARSVSTAYDAAADQATAQHPADHCVICAVVAMAGTVLFATPPLLLLPEAVEFLYRTTDAEFDHLKSAGAAFQPHAPPAS